VVVRLEPDPDLLVCHLARSLRSLGLGSWVLGLGFWGVGPMTLHP
jgi:hypothetical protein